MVAFAHIGPLTTVFEAVATSIGAGIVVGSFAAGVIGLVENLSRKEFEGRVLRDGYYGGVISLVALVIDLAVGYPR